MHSFPMRGTSLHHDEEILTGPPAPSQLGGDATLLLPALRDAVRTMMSTS